MHEVLDKGARDDEAAVDLGDVVGGRLGDPAPGVDAGGGDPEPLQPGRVRGGDLAVVVHPEIRVGRVGSPVERVPEPLEKTVRATRRARERHGVRVREGRVLGDELAHAAGLERLQPSDAHVAVTFLIVQQHVTGELAVGWRDLGRLHDVDCGARLREKRQAQARTPTTERGGSRPPSSYTRRSGCSA